MNLKEAVTDLAFGIAGVAIIFGSIFGAVMLMEAIDMTKDSIRIALFVPLFLYFCYSFGGLTRSVYFKK